MAPPFLQLLVCAVFLLSGITNALVQASWANYSTKFDSSATKSYMVGIRSTPTSLNECAGVLISKNYVLSSNCYPHWTTVNGVVLNSGPNSIPDKKYASIASRYNDGDTDGERIEIADWIRHPDYDATTGDFNFFLFKLANASSYRPILVTSGTKVIPSAGSSIPAMGWLAGSGSNSSLVEKQFTTMKFSRCHMQTNVDLSMRCVLATTAKDACTLNAGSPLVVTKNSKDYLLGLLNVNNACDKTGTPIVFHNPEKVRNWIKLVAKSRIKKNNRSFKFWCLVRNR